ncbi:hypothetical protein [Carboxydothermus ferrireducens]|uniref:Selenophosphate synthetase-related protein n=1 Tax=Carboxydothermus ferrireducens DSM 11255 TaxID=1119529 RepID=A0ABX2R661_9THEO|nr:hypothetical protein [Carboxydothermus ferrireducens]NYE56654.1 selenophosphate synthetase-related protein [Carboxydothermus ferrireducens DSM 11255]
MAGFKYRDLTIVPLSREKMVIAADSIGGVGPKAGDIVKTSGEIVGRYGARVVLMELLAVKARPQVISCTVSCEWEPTGKEIYQGVLAEVKNLPFAIEITGSSEKNFTTNTTGAGFTAVGLGDELLVNRICETSDLYIVGVPLVGEEVLKFPELQATPHLVYELSQNNDVLEIIPCGSGGVGAELMWLKNQGFEIESVIAPPFSLEKSAGPGTSLLVAVKEGIELKSEIPVHYLGKATKVKKA